MKAVCGLLLLGLMTACMGVRMQENEHFLVGSGVATHVTIVSFLPANDSSGTFLALLLLRGHNEGKTTASSWSYRFAPGQSPATGFAYNDSLKPVATTAFPVVVQPAFPSGQTFSLFLKRTGIDYAQSAENWQLRFPKQLPFQTRPSDHSGNSNSIEPLAATFARQNGLEQPGTLFVQTIDSCDFLFDREQNDQYVWLNMTIAGENHQVFAHYKEKTLYHLYTSLSADWQFTDYSLAGDELRLRVKKGSETLDFTPFPGSHATGSDQLRIIPAAIHSGETFVGTAILYIL